MPSLTFFLQHLGLALRLTATYPALEPAEAFAHATEAMHAATDEVSPELLLAIAFVESRFDPTALSRIEGNQRRGGRWPYDVPPPKLTKGTSMFCGVLQTRALTWRQCLAQRDLRHAYTKAVHELETWLHDRRVRGDLTLALAGYACGNRGVKTGKCKRYPGRVLWQARRLERAKAVTVADRM
jgi:hypothetical protein